MRKMLLPDAKPDAVEDLNTRMGAVKVQNSGELGRLQEKQRAAVERSVGRGRERGDDSLPQSTGVHPDLHDLNFGELGDNHA